MQKGQQCPWPALAAVPAAGLAGGYQASAAVVAAAVGRWTGSVVDMGLQAVPEQGSSIIIAAALQWDTGTSLACVPAAHDFVILSQTSPT